MGLDQYIYTTFDADSSDNNPVWTGRKENWIHGWMQANGEDCDDDSDTLYEFCITDLVNSLQAVINKFKELRPEVAELLGGTKLYDYQLNFTEDEMEDIKQVLKDNDLEPTTGFFFGSKDIDIYMFILMHAELDEFSKIKERVENPEALITYHAWY